MQQIVVQREVLIDASLAHVWQLVATEEGLRQWWGNTIFLEAKEGGRCEEWRNDRQQPTRWQGVVTTYAPPHQLMLTMRAQEAQQEMPELTTIAITLEARNNGTQTRVHVTQRAFGAMAAVGTVIEVDKEAQSKKPIEVPLAQLQRPAPGAYPLPQAASLPAVGSIYPSYTLLTQQQSEAIDFTWQQRLNTLIEGVSHAK